jgi:glycerol-3-phosphate dehydrogenase
VGGALWHDAHAPRPQRLLMEVLRWAASEGALAANYVEVLELLEADGVVTGVVARDRVKGESLTFRSGVVVACAGPWSTELSGRLDRPLPGLFTPSLAFNVLFDRVPDFDGALAVTAPRAGARTYFLLPAHGGLLAGTYHAPVAPGTVGVVEPAAELTAAFAAELDQAVPGLQLGSARARHVFWGHLPVRREGTVDLLGREVIHDHGAGGGPRGLFTVSGVKFTVARAVALRTLRAIERFGCQVSRSDAMAARPRPFSVPDVASLLSMAEHDTEAAEELVRRIVEDESVVHEADLLLRRTDWALDGDQDPRVSRLVARAGVGPEGGLI